MAKTDQTTDAAPQQPPTPQKATEPDRKALAAASRILAAQTGTTVAAAAERIRKEPALLERAIETLQKLQTDLTK